MGKWLKDAVELMANPGQVLTADWKPVETAPKDGTWILLRCRNGAGKAMVPVVAAWRIVDASYSHMNHVGYAWRDSANFTDLTGLVVARGADWMPLP